MPRPLVPRVVRAVEPSPGARLSWEQAARDLPAVLARVRAGETVWLTDGDHVVAQVAPPPRTRRGRARPRPVFGALRAEGPLADTFFDPLPEDELRAWEGDADGGGTADAGGADQGGAR